MTDSPDLGNIENATAAKSWVGMAVTGAKGVGKSALLDLLVQASSGSADSLSEGGNKSCLVGVEGRKFLGAQHEFVAWKLDDASSSAGDLVEIFSKTDLVVHVTDGSSSGNADNGDELQLLYHYTRNYRYLRAAMDQQQRQQDAFCPNVARVDSKRRTSL